MNSSSMLGKYNSARKRFFAINSKLNPGCFERSDNKIIEAWMCTSSAFEFKSHSRVLVARCQLLVRERKSLIAAFFSTVLNLVRSFMQLNYGELLGFARE